MDKHKYTTSFSSILRPMVSEEKDKHLALASVLDVSSFVPDVDTSKNIDLLPVAFNACVANRVNRNGDVIDTNTALDIYKSFINKPINLEHNRQRVIGTILSASFSEFGTDSLIDKESLGDESGPFNITLGGVIWKVVNSNLADMIEESNDPTSEHYLGISASWELGFTDYHLLLVDNEEKNIANAEVIDDPEEIKKLKENLKIFGGSGKTEDNKSVYRKVVNSVIPLGIGLTETPAADVEGVAVKKDNDIAAENTENNISQSDKTDVIKEKRVLTMKITKLEDITDENLNELKASAVSEFIHDELKKATDEHAAQEKELQDSLEAAKSAKAEIEKSREETHNELSKLKEDLEVLLKEKAAKAAEEQFNQRMAHMDDTYDLESEDREVIANDIKDMNEETFESYDTKMATLMRHKNKELLAEQAKAQKVEEVKASEEDVKAETETEAPKAEEKTPEEPVAEAPKAAEEAVEEALDSADTEASNVPPTTAPVEEPTVYDKYKKAFDVDQWSLK